MDKSLPRWVLSNIYPSCTSKEFNDDIALVEKLANDVVKAMENDAKLIDVINQMNEIYSIAGTLGSYAYCSFSTDSESAETMGALNKAENVMLPVQNAQKVFAGYAAAKKDEFGAKELEEYQFILNEFVETSKHLMPLEMEGLADELDLCGGGAFGRLQESLLSVIGDGEKTVVQLRSDAMNPDRNIRKSSYEKEIAAFKEHKVSFAYALNGVKGTVIALSKRRGWNDPMEAAASSSRITMKTLNALIGALEKSLPMFREYFGIKAKLLGQDKLAFYDLFASVGEAKGEYSFSDARAIVEKCFSGFSKDMGDFAKKAFENNWIDAEPHKGKVGGAYDTSVPKVKESRILTNFDFTLSSVLTLSHELGHAYHDSVVLPYPPLLAEYPMPLAETASIFAEQVVFQELLKDADKGTALSLIENFVSDCAQVCVDILSRFYFERDTFKKRAEGDITPDEFSAMMLDAQERTYGDALDVKHEYMWAVKGHYYSTGLSYYNYPYAFGQLFALALFKKSKDDSNFASSYRELLSLTGRNSAEAVAASAGCDIETEEFWLDGIAVIASYVEKMKAYL